MYIGRFLVVGPGIGAYRVSSRSFPNRKIIEEGNACQVRPTTGADTTDNPFVSYTCSREVGDALAFGNGSHVDPIADKLELGYPPRDALAMGLLTMDFERDEYDTPRIGAILHDGAHIGVVRRDGITVREVTEPHLVATYERNEPTPYEVDWSSAAEAAREAYRLDFEHPVCALGIIRSGEAFETAIHNGTEEKA